MADNVAGPLKKVYRIKTNVRIDPQSLKASAVCDTSTTATALLKLGSQPLALHVEEGMGVTVLLSATSEAHAALILHSR